MKPKNAKNFIVCAGLLLSFVVFTFLVMRIDVRPIGPNESVVGFAAFNGWARDLIGVHMALYHMTDWASILALLIAMGFAILGLCQWVKRKKLLKVDSSILVLGGFYMIVFAAYLFFEYNIVNYRPVLIDGFLEASYPSSTTMLVMCMMPTAMMQFHRLIKSRTAGNIVNTFCALFTGLMVIGRLLSGVHWVTDIIGGALLSAGLVLFYFSANAFLDSKIRA